MRLKTTFKLEFGSVKLRVKVFPSLTALRVALADHLDGPCDLVQAVTFAPHKGRHSLAVWFAADALRLTYIAHEAVHVDYAIGRWGVNPWQDMFQAEEEERIAYPAGEVTSALYATLLGAGWQVGL